MSSQNLLVIGHPSRDVSTRKGAVGRLVAIVALIAVVVGATLYFVAYQGQPGSFSSSAVGPRATGTLSSESTNSSGPESSSTSNGVTIATTTGGAYILACNCTLNLNKVWPEYETMTDLASGSQAIIVGNVTSEQVVGEDDSYEFGGSGYVPLVPVTNYNVTVTTVLLDRGYGLAAGYWTIIPQVGGTFGHTTLNLTGYPSLSVGTSYVFFLTNQSPIWGVYYHATTTGGSQGLFYIKGGDVYSLDNLYPQVDSWLPVKANGVPLAQFLQEIQSAITSSSTETSSTLSSASSNSTAVIG